MGLKEENDYLKNLVKILSNRLVYSTKPYDLTINEIHEEIRTLEELRELLEFFHEPVRKKRIWEKEIIWKKFMQCIRENNYFL